MREPKLYGPYPPAAPGRSERYSVRWREADNTGKIKQFTDPIRAELFYQEKLLGQPIDKDVLILKEVATIKKYIASGRIGELESENAKLRADNSRLFDELAAAKRQTPRVAEPQKKQFCSKILIHRPELVQALQDRGARPAQARIVAVIIQQLSYLVEQGFGKVLGDGRTYIFGKYNELHTQYFSSEGAERTLRRGFKAAEKLGMIDSKQPEGNLSRRKYYALTAEAAKLAASGKKADKKAATKGQNGRLQEEAKMAASSSVQEENPADAVSADLQRAQLYDLAATATDWSDVVEKLKAHFPSHNVASEMRNFRKYRYDHGRPNTSRAFVDWMMRAELPLSPPKRTPRSADSATPITVEHEEQIDPEQHARFLKEMEEWKTANRSGRLRRLK